MNAGKSHEGPLRVCARCVMDSTDPDIRFDAEGVCNYCHQYDRLVTREVFSGDEGRQRLASLVARVRREGQGKPYDCVVGLSGGVDSTYAAWQAKEAGLRPLAVHLDNGWDSELAVDNIERVLRALGLDLYTHVIDWEEFRDLQLSFLRASTPDSEIPTDHAIVALLYQTAERHGVRTIVTGCNVRTESHHSAAWSQGHSDWRYIRSVHKRFGSRRLHTFPHMNLWDYRRYATRFRNLEILNYLDYRKIDALKQLQERFGWRPYAGKHFESIYTRFYQSYILPRKFGFDKRKSHLSSLVCSKEISREDALLELQRAPCDPAVLQQDRPYFVKKLGITEAEFDKILEEPARSYWEYPSYGRLYRNAGFNLLRAMARRAGLIRERREAV